MKEESDGGGIRWMEDLTRTDLKEERSDGEKVSQRTDLLDM